MSFHVYSNETLPHWVVYEAPGYDLSIAGVEVALGTATRPPETWETPDAIDYAAALDGVIRASIADWEGRDDGVYWLWIKVAGLDGVDVALASNEDIIIDRAVASTAFVRARHVARLP